MISKSIGFAIVLATLVSCGTVKRSAISMGSGVINEASYELETESNWENFRRAVPGNLKMIEGLLYVNKNNSNLMATLTKGYGAYSFVVYDTLNLEDFLSENGDEKNREQALLNYRRSVEYGLQFFKENGLDYDQLLKASNNEKDMFELLDSEISDDDTDVEAVFFTGLSFMNMVNLNKTNLKLVAQLPVAKGMIDWACSKKPKIGGNNCQVIDAIYMASRPRTFGGDPERGKQLFKKFIAANPDHWFARIAYIQFYLIPMMDDLEYKKQKAFFVKARKAYKEQINWTPLQKDEHRAFKQKNMRIYQALAIKRFDIIEKYEKDIF